MGHLVGYGVGWAKGSVFELYYSMTVDLGQLSMRLVQENERGSY